MSVACEYICDGCGKREPAQVSLRGEYIKPRDWFSRRDGDGTQVACSRECIEQVAAATGKTGLVAPI